MVTVPEKSALLPRFLSICAVDDCSTKSQRLFKMTSLKRLWPAWPGWILGTLLLIIGNIHCTVAPEPPLDGSTTGNTFVQDLKMPGVQPTQNDEYICTAKRVESREAFIVQYEAHSPNNKAHHILLFGCKDVDPKNVAKGHWGCGEGNICQNMKIMFAWAKNAPPTTLPADVGFRIGGDSGVNYLVLEIHYAHPLNGSDSSGILLHTTYEPQTYIAGIFLLLAQDSKIPPRHPAVHTDINCLYKSRIPIHPFAYRVHAHSLGVVISGYKYNTKNSEWTQLGKGNPQWPQAFYPMDKVHKVDNTDILVARCTFNSTGRDRWTYIGSTAADEMCNFYIMYYTDSQRGSPFGECVDAEYPGLVDMMPLGSDVPLPRNPLLEEHAHGSNSMQHSKVTKRPLNIPQDSSLETPLLGGREHEGPSGFDPTSESSEYNGPVPYRGKVHHGNYNQGTEDNGATTGAGVPSGKAFLGISANPPLPNLFKDQSSWPNLQRKLGQVTAVSLDNNGNVWIFHRGNRVWDASTFDVRNRFMQMSLGPILENTVIKLDKDMGTVLHEWGNNLFYMPHGLTIDKDGNIWITDVAMHQVMKFPPGGNDGKPILSIGTPFEPGSDNSHFCKPASVAVAESGEFFVADGYCNSRILKYSPTGTLQLQWGKSTTAILNFKIGTPPPYAFDIPHKVALAEDKGLVCVADRENGRIQCFNMNNGSFHCQMQPPEFGGRLFAVAYSPDQGGLLYAVNGPTIYGNTNNVQGFVVNLTSQQVIGSIRPQSQNLQNPHDIAVSSDGSAVYVAEIGPNKLWKFISIRLASSKQLPVSMTVANKSAVQQPIVKLTPSTTLAPSLPLRNTQRDNKEVSMSPLSNDSSSFALSMIIIAVLSIPILLMIIITIVIRLRKQGKFHSMNLGHVKGWMTGYKQPNSDRFNLGNFLHPHKGFDRVSMEESDAELDNSDSDVEEYSASVQKA